MSRPRYGGPPRPPAPLSKAGWTIGEAVKINSKNRHSHGWNGEVDGFCEDVPGVLRVRVKFERNGRNLLMSFHPTELVSR